MHITYYDGEDFQRSFGGKFPIGAKHDDDEHKLTNLTESTRLIVAHAADDRGNFAVTTFSFDHTIPVLSYTHISRTPSSILIKGLRVKFPDDDEEVNVIFSCDGHDDVSYTWRQEDDDGAIDGSSEYEIPGYGQSWEGPIMATALGVRKGYMAQCEICVDGLGEFLLISSNKHRNFRRQLKAQKLV